MEVAAASCQGGLTRFQDSAFEGMGECHVHETDRITGAAAAQDTVLSQWSGVGPDASSAALSLLPKKKTAKPLEQAVDVALTLFQSSV